MRKYKPLLKENRPRNEIEISLRSGNVQKALDILHDLGYKYAQTASNAIEIEDQEDYEDVLEVFKKHRIELY